MVKDRDFMQRALELAIMGRGYTSPNPMVGAVLVKQGRIIGQGFHERYGDKHAEIRAIENAVEPVEGATLYCNLEPCCHTIPGKKTPPCTHRLIQERIRKVVVSTIDPNPHVSGSGLRALKAAGIEIQSGIFAREATLLNEAYFKFIQTGEPFIHLKIAQSLDGRIATRSGDARWITDVSARQMVQEMRQNADAILVGIGTVLVDNPRLTLRTKNGRQPYRIVLDSRLRIPDHATLLQDQFADRTIIITSPDADKARREALAHRGIRVEVLNKNSSEFIDLDELMVFLQRLGVASLLVEGGSAVFTRFIQKRRFDKLSVFIAPILIGEGREAIQDLHINRLQDALRLELVTFRTIGHQMLVEGYRDIHRTFGKLAEELTCSQDSWKKWEPSLS